MDLEAAENSWACSCNGCKKAAKRERERIAALIQEQHLLAAEGELRRYNLRMIECRYKDCDCYAIIDMIMEENK